MKCANYQPFRLDCGMFSSPETGGFCSPCYERDVLRVFHVHYWSDGTPIFPSLLAEYEAEILKSGGELRLHKPSGLEVHRL